MPRLSHLIALLCPLILAGCSGLGVFLDDTHSPTSRVNAPIGNSETARRVEGRPVAIEALGTQPGNVWPGPVPAQATLEDLQKEPPKPLPDLEGSTAPSLSNLPGLVIPVIPHHLQPRPGEDSGVLNGPLPPSGPAHGPTASPTGTITPTANGNAVSTRNPSGLGQINPQGLGITVPNGDGTSTVVAPDGTVSTIKTPK